VNKLFFWTAADIVDLFGDASGVSVACALYLLDLVRGDDGGGGTFAERVVIEDVPLYIPCAAVDGLLAVPSPPGTWPDVFVRGPGTVCVLSLDHVSSFLVGLVPPGYEATFVASELVADERAADWRLMRTMSPLRSETSPPSAP
jgi:hypothetical protein